MTPRASNQWLRDSSLADIPHSGEPIASGRPICTVFATGEDAEDCTGSLVAKACWVYQQVEPAARGVA